MALQLTKRVKYTSNERLDLLDKLAEDTLLDATLHEARRQLFIESATRGRVLQGFKTSTVPGPNGGFTLPAAKGVAIDNTGALAVMDGTTSLTTALQYDAINYLHLYYDEDDSDSAVRRFYRSGDEVSDYTDTRITRTCKLYRATAAYGTPTLGGFSTSATVDGVLRQLIPLCAVCVNGANTITSVHDFRPMWAPNINGAGSNEFTADTHDFGPTDAATLGITDLRTALVGITNRVKQLKGTTNWWDEIAAGCDLLAIGARWATYSGTTVYHTGKAGVTYQAMDGGARLYLEANDTDFPLRVLGYSGSSANVVTQLFSRSRGSYSAPANVAAGDVLGKLSFTGLYSGTYYDGATITAEVDATPGASDMPSRLCFWTSPDASATPLERLRIGANGNVGLGTNNPDSPLDILDVVRVGTAHVERTPTLSACYLDVGGLSLGGNSPGVGWNCWFDGTNWQRHNTSNPSFRLYNDIGANALRLNYAAAGSGVITFSPSIVWRDDGAIGLGTSSVTADMRLDAVGTILTRGDFNWNYQQLLVRRTSTNWQDNGFKVQSFLLGGDNASHTDLYQHWNFIMKHGSLPGPGSVSGGSTEFRIQGPGPFIIGLGSVEVFRVSMAGLVGVGTAAPKNKLDVVGSIAVGTYAGVSTAPGNSIIVSGKIGIGATNPTYPLEVKDGTSGFAFDAANQHIGTTFGNGGLLALYAELPGSANGPEVFMGGSQRDDAAKNVISFGSGTPRTTHLTIDGNFSGHTLGNVGIGTTSPTAKLHVANATTVQHGIYCTTAVTNAGYAAIYGSATGVGAVYGLYGSASGDAAVRGVYALTTSVNTSSAGVQGSATAGIGG
jgi:hypothetical protein